MKDKEAEWLRKERDDAMALFHAADKAHRTTRSDLAAAQAQIEAMRAVNTHGADTIVTVLILDIAAALQGRDRVVVTTDETSLGPRILEFAAALAALPVKGVKVTDDEAGTLQDFVKWCSTANSLHQVQMRAHQLLEDKSD